MALPSSYGRLGFQNCEKIKFYCFQSPGSWPFVTLALGNVSVWKSKVLALLLDFNFSCRDPRKQKEPTCLPCHPVTLSLGIVSKHEGNHTNPSSCFESCLKISSVIFPSIVEVMQKLKSSCLRPRKFFHGQREMKYGGLGSLQRHGHIDPKRNLRPEPRSRIPNPENMESSWR